jgi:lipoate-protein ligase A
MNVQHGIIKSFDYKSDGCSPDVVERVRSLLVGQKLQDVSDWRGFLQSNIQGEALGLSRIAHYLSKFLPIPDAPAS